MRYHAIFSYDGSNFFGYQKQPRKRTIQRELEKALKKINDNKKVNVSSSGRTDAGVHALNQHAHFDMKINIKPDNLCRALNSLLPNDIYIKKIYVSKEDFHSRFDATSKEYIYKINTGMYDPISSNYVYQYSKELNINKMIAASKYLLGEHDFRSFVKDANSKDDCIRNIYEIIIDQKDNVVTISIKGSGFMRYMVRNIVGTLIDVSEGKYEAKDMENILTSQDRRKAGKCAPACGLYLKDVYY